MLRLPKLGRKNALRLFLLLSVALLAAVAARPAALLAADSTSSTTNTAASQAATTESTTATAAPSTSPAAASTTAAGTSPADTGLVPPAGGYSPLNPGLKTDQMDVQVWPEYDQKAVLVFLSFSLPADVQLPATFKFAVPKGAVIAGIGERDPNGTFKYNYAGSYPPVEPGADWDIVTIQVKDFRALQIDYYYDPGIPAEAGPRSFPLLLQLPLDVDTMLLHVQQPARSTDFTVRPALQGSGSADDGFTYAVATFSGVEAGSTLGQVISYNKSDSGLSIDKAASGASTKISTNTVLLAAILVVVVGVGALVVYRLYRNTARTARAKGRPSTRPGPTPRPAAATRKSSATEARGRRQARDAAPDRSNANKSLCTECGEALGRNDQSCPSCGAPREE